MKNPALNRRLYRPAYRKFRAYRTALAVSGSYLWLALKSRLRGKAYYRNQLPRLHQQNAQRIKTTILELQGLFIKFGQLISILSNVLPEQFREPLTSLQDKIPARPFEEVARTFQAETGKSITEVFDHIEPVPIASASIGQVHRARLNGLDYVVKIQHADIETIATADLAILKRLVAVHAFFMDMTGMDYMYEQVRAMIEDELDYLKEGTSMERLSQALAREKDLRVVIPEVFQPIKTRKVLISRYCPGVNASNIQQLDQWGIDRKDLAARLLILYSKMILVDGFYHADPHPGNILVNAKGDIILLDYGAVAEISEKLRSAIPELIEAVIRDDTEGTVAALKKMGFISNEKDSVRMAEHLIQVFRNFLQEEVNMEGMNFASIHLSSGFGSLLDLLKQVSLKDVSRSIQIPKDYVLLNRTVVLLLGLSFQLAPDLNPLDTVRPYLKEHLGAQRKGITQIILNALRTQLATAVALPQELQKFLKNANRGELEYEVKGLKEGFRRLYLLGQQFLFLSAGLACLYLVTAGAGELAANRLDWLWGGVAVFSFLFLRSWWKGEK